MRFSLLSMRRWKALYEAKVIPKTTMRKFDELCLTPEEIYALRKREGVSRTRRRCQKA